MNLPKIVGHRGAATHAPENTLAGLRQAAAFGAAWVEFDVMLSRDGVPLLHHDKSLARTTGDPRLVTETTLAELKTLDAGTWFGARFAGERIPTFAEAIAVLAELGLGANVEIKPAPGRESETAEAVVAELQQSWPATLPPPLLSSFEDSCIEVALARAPELPRGHLYEAIPKNWRDSVARLDCRSVHGREYLLDQEIVAQIREAGYRVVTYTVNDPARAVLLDSWGVDTIITDDIPAITTALAKADAV